MATQFTASGAPLMSAYSLAQNGYFQDYSECFWTADYHIGPTYWADEAFQRANGDDNAQSMYDRIMAVDKYDRMWEYQCLGRRNWQEYGPTIYADQAYQDLTTVDYATQDQRQAAYDWVMALPEVERCKGFLILEKFNFRPPADNIAYGLKAYEMSGGHQKGEDSARYLIGVDPAESVLVDFFMLMTSNWQFTSAATLWGDFAYQIGGGPPTGQEWYDRIQDLDPEVRANEFTTMINEGLFSYMCYDNTPQPQEFIGQSGDQTAAALITILNYIVMFLESMRNQGSNHQADIAQTL